jgi:hypothetical protein
MTPKQAAVNPLKIRVTTTQAGDVHVSYEPPGPVNAPVGFCLTKHEAKCLAQVIHKTPPHGLEAFAALIEQAAGLLPELNLDKLKDLAPKLPEGQVKYDYGQLRTGNDL